MKRVTFKNISVRNFLSVGEDSVDVTFRSGMNIITGENHDKPERRNGVGKSTLADAIHFALFGDTIRELKKEHIVNNITQSGCEVILNLLINDTGVEDEYTIIRRLKPTKCFLLKNGDDITRDSIANTTTYISDLISSTADVFQSCVIMTVNNTTPFMAKKKIDKRKFIEGILNLQVFSDMLTHVRGEYNNMSKEFDIECARYEEASKLIQTYEQQYIKHRSTVAERKTKIKARIEENSREELRITEQIEKYNNYSSSQFDDNIAQTKSKLEKCETKLQTHRDRQTSLTTEIMLKTDNLNKINVNAEACPTCLRPITGDDKKNIQKEKDRLSHNIQKLIGSKEDLQVDDMLVLKKLLEEKITDLQSKKIDNETIKSRVSDLRSQHDRVRLWGEQLSKDISSDDTVSEELSSNTKAAVNRLDEIQQQIDKLKFELNQLDIIKFIVSEEGVKSYIVKKILQVLNNKLAYYLKKMDSNCICIFNEYFEEQIFDERGKLCSYFNFSGAERKNIDLACLFAFMDIRRLQGDVVYNFSVYDELLDSSLDEKGIDLVIHILKERVLKYNEMVYIISHRKESITFVGESIGDIILLKKHKGITTRVAHHAP
jgi:DNA repair exonuclease SbcCD ATPase subunit